MVPDPEMDNKKPAAVPAKPPGADEPSVKAEIEGGGAFVLTLTLPIIGFPVEFSFKLLPVAREHIDILETALRDAEDEIEKLKRENASLKARVYHPAVIALRSTVACTNGGYMTWNVLERNLAPDIFVLQPNQQNIQVKAAGLYQISVRATSTDNTGGRYIRLLVNNAIISQSQDGFNTGFNGTVQLVDMINLNENAMLSVVFGIGTAFVNAQYSNQFWIMKID